MENWRAALIVSMVANTARDPKKRRKPYTPYDFLPSDARPDDWESLQQKAMGVFAMFGGREVAKDDG